MWWCSIKVDTFSLKMSLSWSGWYPVFSSYKMWISTQKIGTNICTPQKRIASLKVDLDIIWTHPGGDTSIPLRSWYNLGIQGCHRHPNFWSIPNKNWTGWRSLVEMGSKNSSPSFFHAKNFSSRDLPSKVGFEGYLFRFRCVFFKARLRYICFNSIIQNSFC